MQKRYHINFATAHENTMEEEIVSKTRLKQQMHALQDVGAALVKLNNQQLGQLKLPERLLAAVQECKRLTKHEAIRRQMQYIGKIMREVDPAPIQAQLDAWNGVSDAETAKLHAVERWRERLLADDAELAGFVADHPQTDVQGLRTLIRNARQEKLANKPPRHYRSLFRALRGILSGQPTAEEDEAEDE